MNMRTAFSFACFLSITCPRQLAAQDLSRQEKSVIEKNVDSVFHAMIKAAERFDYDMLNRGVDDKYEAGFISNGMYFPHFDSLLNLVKTRSQGVARQTISIAAERITVLSGNIVLLTAYGDATADLDSGSSFDSKFYWSFVYEKIDNSWKVIQSHQSNYRQGWSKQFE